MTKNKVIVMIAGIASVGAVVHNYAKVTKEERAKRKAIKIEEDLEVAAWQKALEVSTAKLMDPTVKLESIPSIMNELHFNQIMIRNEMM